MTELMYERELGGIHEELRGISNTQIDLRDDVRVLTEVVGGVKTQVIELKALGCSRGEDQDKTLAEHAIAIQDLRHRAADGSKGAKIPVKQAKVLGMTFTGYSAKDLTGLLMLLGVMWLVWSQYDAKRMNAHNEVLRAADVVKTERAIEKRAAGP